MSSRFLRRAAITGTTNPTRIATFITSANNAPIANEPKAAPPPTTSPSGTLSSGISERLEDGSLTSPSVAPVESSDVSSAIFCESNDDSAVAGSESSDSLVSPSVAAGSDESASAPALSSSPPEPSSESLALSPATPSPSPDSVSPLLFPLLLSSPEVSELRLSEEVELPLILPSSLSIPSRAKSDPLASPSSLPAFFSSLTMNPPTTMDRVANTTRNRTATPPFTLCDYICLL